ncbi:MAG: hypothetical protein P4L33_08185 [Capsulimonadaceae bacterium]|nr:hypothetical protein [Capsulimonadaceae bacterium]
MCHKLAYCEKDSGRLVPPGHFFARASFTAMICDASSTRVRRCAAILRRSRTGLARASFMAVIYDASSTRVRSFAAIVRRSRTGLARASFTPVIYDASSTRVRPFAAIVRSQRTSLSGESAVMALSQKRPRRPGSRLKRPFEFLHAFRAA